MEMIISAGLVAVGIVNLICWIYVLVQMFQEEGILHGILGFICGLYAFIWGWGKADELRLRGWDDRLVHLRRHRALRPVPVAQADAVSGAPAMRQLRGGGVSRRAVSGLRREGVQYEAHLPAGARREDVTVLAGKLVHLPGEPAGVSWLGAPLRCWALPS